MIETDNEQTLLGYIFFKFNFKLNDTIYSYNLSLNEENSLSAFIIKSLLSYTDIYISNIRCKDNLLLRANISNKFLGIKIEPISIILKNNYKKISKEITEFQDLKFCSCYKNNPFLQSDGKYNFFILDDIHRYFYENKDTIFPLYATTFLKSRSFIFDKNLFIYNSIYDKPIFHEPLITMKLSSFDDLFKIGNNIYKKNIQFFHNEELMNSNKFKFYMRYSLLMAKCVYINSILNNENFQSFDIENTPKKNEKYFISYFNPRKYFNSKSLDFNNFVIECKYINNQTIKHNKIKINCNKLQNVSYHSTFDGAKNATYYKIYQTIETIKPFLENSKTLDII